MDTDQDRTIIIRYFEEIWNQGRLEVIDEIIDQGYVNHSASISDLPRGPEGLKPIVVAMRKGFPDLHYTIEDLVIGDGKIAARTTMRGTNIGELFGTAPTNRRVEVQQLQIEHIRDGKIVAHWRLTDNTTMQLQLGGR